RVDGRGGLPGCEQLVAWLTERIAFHRLSAVGGKPGGIVARCAPPARVEGRSAVRDPEEGEGAVLGGSQGSRIEVGGPEEQARLGVRFVEVLPQQLDFGGHDRAVLSPARDEDTPLPAGVPHYALELKEIA